MALDITSVRFAIDPTEKWVRKYMAWPAGVPVAGAGRVRVLRMGRMPGLLSPPVKPPGPELQVESLNPGVSHPSPV